MRLAIIGYGETGRAYGLTLRALSGISVDCVIDVDLARAEAGARALGVPAWGDNATIALRRTDLDAVIVTSPHATHPALAKEALERGLHVLLEAPLALRYPDAQQVLAYAHAYNTVLAVNFWSRATPGVRLIRERIPRPSFLQIEAVIDPLRDSWMGTAEHGGVLGLLGSHAFDLACFLMRSQPLYVQALGGRHTRRADLADTVAAGIRFANGGLARVIVGEFGHSLAGSTWCIRATDGVITMAAQHNRHGRAMQVGHHPQQDAPQIASLRAFAGAVAGHGQPLAAAEDGVRAVQIADAAYESMGARRRVLLEEPSLHVSVGPVYADDSVANRGYHGLGA